MCMSSPKMQPTKEVVVAPSPIETIDRVVSKDQSRDLALSNAKRRGRSSLVIDRNVGVQAPSVGAGLAIS